MNQEISNEINSKLARIRLLVSDVDGVLTDGLIRLMDDGREIKAFSCKDAPAIKIAKKAGLIVALTTGRIGGAVKVRADELGIDLFPKKDFEKNVEKFSEMVAIRYGVKKEEVAFVGDDLGDIPFMKSCDFSFCPADASPDVKKRVSLVTDASGGKGVLAECIRLVLSARNEWEKNLGSVEIGIKN